MDVREFLIKLSETPRISGYEGKAAEAVTEAFTGLLDEVRTDKFGNVIGLKKGRGKGRLMFAAHMDEIGMMVANIDENGFIKFTTIGGLDSRTLVAQEVIIHGREPVFGVIGIKPPHLTKPEEAKAAVKLEDLAIDAGYDAETLKALVSVGDVITLNCSASELNSQQISCKSMDDAAGVAALYAAAKRLARVSLNMDVYFVATAQEEVGLRGAATAAYGVEPDIAIAVDVGFGKTPELNDMDTIELGKGPAIGIGPSIHPGVYELLKTAAAENGVKYQIEVLPRQSSTDADAIQISRGGVATGVLSIPVKYMHSPVETVMLDDINHTGRLMAEFAAKLNDINLSSPENGLQLEGALCL